MPFRHLVGHRRLIGLLARAASRGALPPSLIFDGPDGVGKRRAALALAQLFNCSAPAVEPMLRAAGAGRAATPGADADAHAPDACGECASCRRISRGVHADVLVVCPGDSGSIKVDQARQVIEQSAYRPFEGRRRVVIVDGADAMEVSAQNALLKTLEEPPAASTFVLITARPDVLLPTVRSRCQRVRFGRLAPAEVAAVLMEQGFTEAAAHAAAALAAGSVGQALLGDTEAFAEARQKVMAMLRMVGTAREPRARLAAAKVIGGDKGDKVDRDELARRLRLLASVLRDLSLLGVRGDESALANADEASTLRQMLGAFDGERALRAFAAVDRAVAALDRNASPRVVADWLAFQV
jgi:DNA polymerase III subunit delta'